MGKKAHFVYFKAQFQTLLYELRDVVKDYETVTQERDELVDKMETLARLLGVATETERFCFERKRTNVFDECIVEVEKIIMQYEPDRIDAIKRNDSELNGDWE